MADKKDWDQSQLRKYDIQLDEIPRLNAKDPRVDEFIAENVSILMKQSVNIISFLLQC
jgi:hypoxia-inducible factor 1-alpha inhibitor (HIF hydroxylase)